MANTITTARLQTFYVAYYGRAADVGGINYWVELANKPVAEGGFGGNETALIQNLGASTQHEFQIIYGVNPTVAAFLNSVYQNLFGRDIEPDGLLYWTGVYNTEVAAGKSVDLVRTTMVTYIVDGALAADQTAIANKTTYAQAFTASLDTPEKQAAYASLNNEAGYAAARAAMYGVTDNASLATQTSAIDDVVSDVMTGETFTLAEALAETSLPDVYTISAAPAVAGGAVTIAAADHVKAVIAGASNAASLNMASLYTWSIADTAAHVLAAASGSAVTGATAVSVTDAAISGSIYETLAALPNFVVGTTTVNNEYTFTAAQTTAKDGDTVEFTLDLIGTNFPEEVTYTLTGVTADMVVGGSLTGTAAVVDGEAVISVTLRADAANGANETLTVSVTGISVPALSVSVVDSSATATTQAVTLAQIVAAGGVAAGSETIIVNAGNTGTVNVTINSSNAAGDDTSGKVLVSGNANLRITSGTGADKIFVEGTGNNVVNAGAGTDSIFLASGNDVVIIGATGDFTGAENIVGGDGNDTVVVNGTNVLSTGTIDVENLVLNAGANVTLKEDQLASLSTVVAKGTTAQLTIANTGSTDTVDLSGVLVGSLSKLTVENGVTIRLTAAQIQAITTFTDSGTILTDAEGAALLAAKGYTGGGIEGGVSGLEAATAADSASVDALIYEVSVAAEEAYDQLYLNGTAANQLTDAGATTKITTTATIAQALTIKGEANAIGGTYAIADTAANIAATLDGTGNDTTGTGWLNETDISALTLTTAATVAEAKTIFHAAGDLKAAVTAAAAVDNDAKVITLPTYSISDTAANLAANANDAIVKGAATITITNDATVAQAVAILATLSAKISGGYNLEDSAANLYAAGSAVRNGATDITVTVPGTAMVVQATRIDGYNNTGTTTFALNDSAAALFSAPNALLAAASAVTVTTAMTVAQLTKLAPYLESDYAFTLSDTAANLTSTGGLALIAQFDNITVTPTSALTLAQARTLEDTVADLAGGTLNDYDITDTATNIIAAINVTATDSFGLNSAQTAAANAAEALIDDAVTAVKTVTATGNVSVANAKILIGANGNASIKYSLSDTAAKLVAGGDAAVVTNAQAVTVSGNATAAEAVTLAARDTANANCTIAYTVSDTAAAIAAVLPGNSAELVAATSVTATGNATVAQAQKIVTLNTALVAAGKTAVAYAISDNVTGLGVLDAAVPADVSLLNNATSVKIAGNTGNEIKTFATGVDDDIFALVDSYAITVTSESAGGNPLSGDITAAGAYYDGATSVTVSTTVTAAQAADDYDLLVADSNDSKLVFTAITDSTANLVAAADVASQAAAVGKGTTVTIDSTGTTSVADAQAVAALVTGTLSIDNDLTDTVANLVAGQALLSKLKTAASGKAVATDEATVAQYATLISKFTSSSAAKLEVNISDTITSVQGASVAVLKSLDDNAGHNKIYLKAGSEVSLTVAQATELGRTGATNTFDDVIASDGVTEATYELVDSMKNLIAKMTDFDTAGALLTNASTIIATGNFTVPNEDEFLGADTDAGKTYLDALETLVSLGNFDVLNSTYSLSGTAAKLATVSNAVANATAVTVTDTATIAEATAILGDNAAATFAAVQGAADDLFDDLDADTMEYQSGTVADIAAASSAVVITDAVTVEQAQKIVDLLGSKSVAYLLQDTAANLAAAGSLLANATAIEVDNGGDANATVAQVTAILAGATHADFAGLTYDLEDTAANLAAASEDILTGADSSVVSTTDATMAQAIAIESVVDVALDVVDTAAAIAAGLDDLLGTTFDTSGTDTITLTTAATLAQAAAFEDSGETFGTAEVEGLEEQAGTIYVKDTYANLLNAANAGGFDIAEKIIVSGAVNVSKAAQIADAFDDQVGALASREDALAKMVFDLSETQVYTVVAFEEQNELLGYANSINVIGVGAIEVYDVSGTNYIVGTAAEVGALPAELREVGYVIRDSIANYVAAAELATADAAIGSVLIDTSANVLATSPAVTQAALEVRVTNVVSAATLAEMQALLTLNLTDIAGVSDTAANLASADLTVGNQDIATVTVTDAYITQAQADEIDGLGAGYVYTLRDTYANLDTDPDIENAQAVIVTNTINVANAATIFAKNEAVTMSIVDTAGNLDSTTDADVAALTAAASISLTAGQTVTVDQLELIDSYAGFDGVYTLNDTAANLVAAGSSLLTGAVQVQVSGAATVAQATVLAALANIKLASGKPDFTITDSAANLSAASASLLDDVAAITIGDSEVTAAQAKALQALIANAAVVGLTAGDTFDIVDTYANITNATNASGVSKAFSVEITDAVTITQARAVIAAATVAAVEDGFMYKLTGTRLQLQGATAVEAGYATDVTVTDAVTAVQAGIINDIYTSADVAFADVTGTRAQLIANVNQLIDQATTVRVSDAMTVAQAEGAGGFIAAVGSKLAGGYEISDSVDNIVNAALNNTFSAAVVQGAAEVSLTGDTTMNIAEAAVITALNFSGAYDIEDTATAIAAAAASLINGADTVTVEMEEGVSELFDATDYTGNLTLDFSANAATVVNAVANVVDIDGVDVITIKTVASASNPGDTIVLSANVTGYEAYTTINGLGANKYTAVYGYRTGDGFVISNTTVEDTLLVYDDGIAKRAIVLSGHATIGGISISDGTSSLTADTYSVAAAKALIAANTIPATFNVVDTGAAIATLTGTELANIDDSIDATDNAVTITHTQAGQLLVGGGAFAGTDAIVVTGTSAELAALSATIGGLGGTSITFNSSNAVSLTHTQAGELLIAGVVYDVGDAITVTGTSAQLAALAATIGDLGGASITFNSADPVSLTHTQAGDLLAAAVVFDVGDAITVTGTSAQLAALSATIGDLGGASITFNSSDPVSLTHTQAGELLAAAVAYDAGDAITVTGTSAELAALSATIGDLGGASITFNSSNAVSLTNVQGGELLAAGVKFDAGDAITITAIANADEAAALTDYVTAAIGGSGTVLDATDQGWTIEDSDLDTALTAGITFAATDTVTVTTIANADEAAALTAYDTATIGGAGTVLDATDDAWAIDADDFAAALTAGIDFAAGDTVTVTAANTTTVVTASSADDVFVFTATSADNFTAIDGLSTSDTLNVLAADGTAGGAFTTVAEASALAVNTAGVWYFDDATDTLTYWDANAGPAAAVTVILTGVASVTADNNGVFSIAALDV